MNKFKSFPISAVPQLYNTSPQYENIELSLVLSTQTVLLQGVFVQDAMIPKLGIDTIGI